MPLSVNQLLTPTTETEAINYILLSLQELGFNTTSWQPGSIQRAIVTGVGKTYSGATDVVRQIVEGTLSNPTGAWLDLLGRWRYGGSQDDTWLRQPAVPTQRNLVLTNAPSAAGHVITNGSTFATPEGIAYRYTGAGEIVDPGETETIAVEAVTAGAAGNVSASDTTIAVQSPSYPGLSVAFEDAPLTQIGSDEESDARYWVRLQLRFADVTYSVGLRAYHLWALNAAPSVRRAKALNDYPTPGLIRVVLDPGLPAEISAVEAYIAERVPPNDDVTVSAASAVNQSIVYAPRVTASFNATAANAAVQAMLDALPIGGVLIQGASAGRLLREAITEVLLCNATLGVQSVGLSTPSADVVLGATDIVTGVFTVTPETVYQ
jgi:phage-related baseplate assembly protein